MFTPHQYRIMHTSLWEQFVSLLPVETYNYSMRYCVSTISTAIYTYNCPLTRFLTFSPVKWSQYQSMPLLYHTNKVLEVCSVRCTLNTSINLALCSALTSQRWKRKGSSTLLKKKRERGDGNCTCPCGSVQAHDCIHYTLAT